MAVGVESGLREKLQELPLSAEDRSLELPNPQVVGPWRVKRPTRKAMLGDKFYVYGQVAELRPPIDWRQDEHESRTWRYELQALTWLKEALARHALGGDIETLAVARDIVLDWGRQHWETAEQSEFAWYDMAVGLRAPYIAYVLRACLAEKMLADEDTELLVALGERHGAELASGANYAAGHNHGLFQDEGLYLLARLLPPLPAAGAWRELAVLRLRATLRETVSFAEGAHLEHSVAYQFAILDLVTRLARNVSELPELAELLGRMRRTAAWQVTPSGRMAQLGDTDDLKAPKWARETAANLQGMNVLREAGQAFVRDGDSYLAVTAGYHSSAHKHADDSGFMLVENGEVLIGDAGRWGYYEDELDRRYARSADAHNVLTADEADFDWRSATPYGSGIEAAGEGGGWYVIVVRNALLERQGVRHRRALFYLPGHVLVVLDRVTSEAKHAYVRHLHLGSGIEAERKDSRVMLSGKVTRATLTEYDGAAEVALARGRDEPRLGWTFPGDRERTAAWSMTLRSHAKTTTQASTLSLGGEPVLVTAASSKAERVAVELDGDYTISCGLSGAQLGVVRTQSSERGTERPSPAS